MPQKDDLRLARVVGVAAMALLANVVSAHATEPAAGA
jgi:hypothetical protein